jgi:exodeoxyribonuclease VII large subunit
MKSETPQGRISRDIYNVTRLNREVRAVLEGSFPLLWLQGEISNLARPASGHIYFSLKDKHSQVRCAMFKNRMRSMNFVPENGMEILASANVGLYEGRGEFQLIMEHMEPAGEGALQRAFEELKQRLNKEGLFEDSHKQEIPAYPESIAVITSASGAAIRDVLQVLKRRYPFAHVLIYPVAVQGKTSATEIVRALELAESRHECDVIILARGGGSLEDLWSFNEEKVARAIFRHSIPIVCGVGHEIDFTIADFVADKRAPTPSAAAELVSPNVNEIRNLLKQNEAKLSLFMQHNLTHRSQILRQLQLRLPHPQRQLQYISQGLDDLNMRMQQSIKSSLVYKGHELLKISAEINHFNPMQLLKMKMEKCKFLREQLENSTSHLLNNARTKLQHLAHGLHTISPLATLERGYAIVSHGEHGAIVRDAGELKEGETIYTRLALGEVESQVKAIRTGKK